MSFLSTRQFVGPVCNMAEDFADLTCTLYIRKAKAVSRCQTFQEVSGSHIGHPVGRVCTCRNGDCWPKIGTYKNVGRVTENVPDQRNVIM